jgi:predicted amidohydrolase
MSTSKRKPVKVAAVQAHLELAAVERNLARIEDLIRDAHREHDPAVIVVPEAMTSPNVYNKAMKGVTRPIDGAPFQLLTRLARELDCVIGGGFLSRRGGDAYGTYVLAEPDGGAHLHDKDTPSAWENHYYRGGDDDGRVHCRALGLDVGLASGWEWARHRTAKRLQGVDLVLGGMCWPSFPDNWSVPPLNWWAKREHDIWIRQNRECPGQLARLVGAPTVYAAHVGPVEAQFPAAPVVPWKTVCLGDTQITAADGTILAQLTLADGEGHIGAEVTPGSVAPLDPMADRFWIPAMTVSTHVAAWHVMNNHGRLDYTLKKLRGKHEWQSLPGGDLPDELPPVADEQEQHFAVTR